MGRIIIMYLIASAFSTANAIRILGIFPIPAKSHFSTNHAILKSLHVAGHRVTMITPFPSEERVENFTYIDFRPTDHDSTECQSTVEEITRMTLSDYLSWTIKIAIRYCANVLKLPAIQEALNSPDKLYDVFMVEILMDFECFLPIAEKLGIPVIGTATVNRCRETDRAMGLPSNPAVLPLVKITKLDSQMSIFERVESVYYRLVTDYYYWKMRNEIKKLYREYFVQDVLISEKDVSLVFSNNHMSVLPRVSLPNVIDVGGISLTPATSLPKDIQTFIDESQFGVILFSLGTLIDGRSMPTKQREAFLAAFASIPQRIIWKFEEQLENLPKNIMISSWLPQRDILEHKNVIAFISHCGIGGIYEAIITGTPIVTMPLFGDQHLNAAILHYQGVGVDLSYKTVTKETVLDALNRIINDTRYYQRMQELSRAFQDRPMTPEASVVYWTEYVVKYDGAPHLKALGTDMPLYKYFMLDIIVLVLVLVGLAIYTIYRRVKIIFASLAQKRKYSAPLKKDE